MLPVLQVGPLAIRLPGLLLLAGVWVATLVIERSAPRFKLSAGTLNNLIFYSLIAGIIGARLGYVLRFLEAYSADPLGVLALNPNTLSVPEGLLAGVMTALVYAQRSGLPFWTTLDALTPGLAVFMLTLGLAHLSSGDAFGAPSSVPWAIDLWGTRRHPSQVYEIIGAAVILVVVLQMKEQRWAPGLYALSFLAITAAMRLFLEAFRGDSVLIFNALRQAQVASMLVLLAALVLMRARTISEGQPS